MAYTLAFFVQGIIEAVGLVALCFAIARIPFAWKNIFLFGLLLTVISFTVQTFSFSFGLHTVLIILMIIFYLTSIKGVKIVKSLWVTFLSCLVLALLELITNTIYINVIGINFSIITSNGILWPILGLPQAVALLIFALLLNYFLDSRQGMK